MKEKHSKHIRGLLEEEWRSLEEERHYYRAAANRRVVRENQAFVEEVIEAFDRWVGCHENQPSAPPPPPPHADPRLV